MKSILNQYLSAKWLKHQDRDYCYFSDDEIASIEPNDMTKDNCSVLYHQQLIKISGQDANTFLQGQLSIDINKPETEPYGCYCSRKGRVIALYYFTKLADEYYLILPKDIADTFIQQIKKYVLFSKVTITKQPQKLVIAASPSTYKQLEHCAVLWINTGAQYIGVIDITELENFNHLINQHAIPLTGDWYWHKNQIHQNITSIYPSSVAKFLPHDLELHTKNALSFDKGCYIGQEIVARMHYKAKLKYHLLAQQQDIPTDGIIGENNLCDFLDSSSGNRLSLTLTKNSSSAVK